MNRVIKASYIAVYPIYPTLYFEVNPSIKLNAKIESLLENHARYIKKT